MGDFGKGPRLERNARGSWQAVPTPVPASDPRVSVVNLSSSTEVRTKGETVAVVLPSGTVLDLWVYEGRDTCSIDVRVRDGLDDVNGNRFAHGVASTFVMNGTGVVVVR